MGWIDAELALVALAAMFSPTTLSFSVFALVIGDRPLRTGLWFYLGALTATLGIGVVAAFVLGDAAASSDPSSPKTWVADRRHRRSAPAARLRGAGCTEACGPCEDGRP